MDKRKFTRISFVQQVLVETEHDVIDAYCLDLSLRGILLARPEAVHWRLEQPITITLTLEQDVRITMRCSVAHIGDEVVGCACDSLDIDSLTALRRLLELNFPDQEVVYRELSELLRDA